MNGLKEDLYLKNEVSKCYTLKRDDFKTGLDTHKQTQQIGLLAKL